ncbi:MAG: hypothetical protein ABI646_01230 [Acidobacteriota bacterium]
MKTGLYSIAILISAVIMSGSAFADVKIKSNQTMSGQSYENTTYIKGKRQRSESMNGMMINLTQCDLRRGVQLNSQTKTYMVNSFDQGAQSALASTATTDRNGVVQSGGRVTTTIATKDTGERKQMFGFTARHLIITMETLSSPDACNKTNTKMQTDGWYIDAEFLLDCDYGYQNYGNYGGKAGGCKDKYEMKTVGTATRAYPVYEKMTMFDESGKETMSIVNEVVELSKATLEAALFEVPADYREVSDASQMYASGSSSGTSATTMGSNRSNSSSSMPMPNNSGIAQSIRGSALSTSAGNSNGSSAKQAGVIRIGLAAVKTGAVGEALNVADLAAAVQNTLKSYLKVPNIEVVNLDARLSPAIAAEAKQKECDYVIYTNVSHKKGGGGGFGGRFGQALGSAIGQTGIGHTGSVAGNIAGQIAAQSIVSATSVSSSVKSKDEITLDLKLNKADGAAALAKVYKVKAKSNGDDIISHVVEQAAEEIVRVIGQ